MKTELVTTLKRQATKILSELHETREPVLITEHGKPSAYLVDAASYELQEKRIRILEGIAKGERDILEGNTLSEDAAVSRLEKWLK
ncbi:MAG: type II toxin-antitoxin system Phd/YefM family antitoxin [Spirochaetales bacterium]|nr:type II toxin-antitoxin system Phd/YefM family antitoxin [Spirochaetales bacterium]